MLDYEIVRGTVDNPALNSLSEACVYYDCGSERTLVWLGGLHEPFLSTSILTTYNMNGLFLRDLRGDWYMEGISGLADNHDESVLFVKNLLERQGTSSVVIAGQSSGGYAALRYSHVLRPNLCVAFAPQTQNIDVGDGKSVPWVQIAPLSDLFKPEGQSIPIVIHLSRSEDKDIHGKWDDWRQIACFMNTDNVTIVRHPFDTHALSLPLYGLGIFYEMINCDIKLYARKNKWMESI